MSLLLCRFIHRLHYYPKTILGVSLILTILAFFAINGLKWEFKLLQLFSEDTHSRVETERFEKEYGGFGMLTLIAESEDIQQNISFIEQVASDLKEHVHLAEYQTEADFFEANKLLYIDLKDLETIRDRIEEGISQSNQRYNPFIIPLVKPQKSQHLGSFKLADLESKYKSKLQPYLGSEDQKTLVLRIYPLSLIHI